MKKIAIWLSLAVFVLLAIPVNLTAFDPAQTVDLIIKHAYVVTMNRSKDIYEDGAVVIKGGRILAVGPAAIAANYRSAKIIDAGGDLVMPGMINTHTHASMTVFRGLGDDVPDRLQRFIFPLDTNWLTGESSIGAPYMEWWR